MKVREIINNGIILEVINIKIFLYLLELNKKFIPEYVLTASIDEICKGQYGVFVEKILRIATSIKGKKPSIYLYSLFSNRLLIVPKIAKILHGRNVEGIFQK